MIYDTVSNDAPIQQGDIFRALPKVEISLQEIRLLTLDPAQSSEPEAQKTSWLQAIDQQGKDKKVLRAILPVVPVDAIVITQNCDAVRADDLSLCEIAPLPDVFQNAADWTKVASWVKNLTKEGTDHLRWFYLPPADTVGFSERMAADFRTVLRLPRPHIETVKHLRVGRLNPVAYEHFREKLAQFFRRYPYNPWYPLNKEEFAHYASQQSESIEPYPWQNE